MTSDSSDNEVTKSIILVIGTIVAFPLILIGLPLFESWVLYKMYRERGLRVFQVADGEF